MSHRHVSIREMSVHHDGDSPDPPSSPALKPHNNRVLSSSSRSSNNKKHGSLIMGLIFPISTRNTQVEAGRHNFARFLHRCFSLEVLEFWDGTSNYIRLAKRQQRASASSPYPPHVDVARALIQEYLLPLSPQKLDLGWEIEDPLIEAYMGQREFEPGSFDACRLMLLKLMQGLRMDAHAAHGGAKSPQVAGIALFLEEEERSMHQLRFQRDVHPLLHLLRRNTTVAGGGGSDAAAAAPASRRTSNNKRASARLTATRAAA